MVAGGDGKCATRIAPCEAVPAHRALRVASKSQKCMIRGMARAVWSAAACRRLGRARSLARYGRKRASSRKKREQAPALHVPDFDAALTDP
jgi:hypothetical protein